MPDLLQPLANAHRLLIDVPLQPVQGTRFQPTGFPDLGAATYQAGDIECLLVESAQSMANRLEAVCWDSAADDLIAPLKGLPYVKVTDKSGAFLTASVLEAHRLNSAYIEKSEGDFFKRLERSIGVDKKRPVDRRKFLAAVLRSDPGCLIHGIFLESLDGRLRVARALSAFIEACDVRVVASGGVKNDRVQAETKSEGEDGKSSKKGFGNVLFHREEFTAQRITASFSLDLDQIRGYGLDQAATNLLTLLALYKIRALLDAPLRLRTACDLAVVEGAKLVARTPAGYELPTLAALQAALRDAIAAAKAQLDGVETVVFAK